MAGKEIGKKNLMKTLKEKAEATKQKVYKAIEELKEKGEKVTILKVVEVAGVGKNSASKYIKLAREEGLLEPKEQKTKNTKQKSSQKENKPKLKPIRLTLPVEVFEKLQALAKEKNKSMGEVVMELMDKAKLTDKETLEFFKKVIEEKENKVKAQQEKRE